ncbi:MAG: hypothetical protein ABI748_13045 [Dokdonella sp.]
MLTLRVGVGSFTAPERAAVVNQRLRELARAGSRDVSSAAVQESDVGLLVLVGATRHPNCGCRRAGELQTALDDWYVSYQINAYTNQANRMATIVSELHQRIQDAFNEAGVEITSPHYLQLRDGNATTIPPQYPAAQGTSSRFLVDARASAARE